MCEEDEVLLKAATFMHLIFCMTLVQIGLKIPSNFFLVTEFFIQSCPPVAMIPNVIIEGLRAKRAYIGLAGSS